MCALQEIYAAEVNISPETALRDREHLLSKPVIYSLLNRIKDFTEWAQCLVLDMVSKYIPSDSDESFDMMNILEDRLQHTNSAVVLATIKVFLHLTISMADVHQQVYERIKAPLLTLVNSGSAEQTYAVLSHLHLLVLRAPALFSNDYKHFYCRYSDPTYVKKLKLEMLTAVANESNTYEIVTELSEYAANVDVAIARESIRAVGKIALQQYDVNAIVDRLLQFLEMEKDYVTAETLVLVKDLLRKYPQWSHDCIAVVGSVSSKAVTEPKAKAALIWMLGEYAYDMPDAPYILEGFVQNWTEENSAEVRLELLTAITKIFFKRPPESIKMLGAALSAGLADAHQDVHDRALLYYRLLQQGVEVAERVVNPAKQAVSVFADTQSSEIKDRIFDEFNSLSVVYQQPSYMFLDKEVRGPIELVEDTGLLPMGPTTTDDVLPSQLVDANDNDLLLGPSDKEDSIVAASNGSHAYNGPDLSGFDSLSAPQRSQSAAFPTPTPQVATTPAATSTSLLDFDDLLGLNTYDVSTPAPSSLKLKAKPSLDPQAFQRKWGQLAVASTVDHTLANVAALSTPQPLIRHMQANLVEVMASGGKAPTFKFFFYAQAADSPPTSGFFLVELIVNTSTASSQVKIKADDASLAPHFQELFLATLGSFGF